LPPCSPSFLFFLFVKIFWLLWFQARSQCNMEASLKQQDLLQK
jgi:hypothetical protein